MKQLIAVSPVLFENANYEPGDKLPTHDIELVMLWIANGTAVWKDAEESVEEPKKRRVKARKTTAPAGLTGEAFPSAGLEQDLVGKPPPRSTSCEPPESTKGRRKSRA